MAPYRRKDSPFWWLCLERPGQLPLRLPTKIPVAGGTERQTKINRDLAQQSYSAQMGDLARHRYQLPMDRPLITFRSYREWYGEHISVAKRGHLRELSLLRMLGMFFDDYRLDQITRELLIEWRTARAKEAKPRTVNRERDMIRHVLGSAVPKYLGQNPAKTITSLRPDEDEVRLLEPNEESAVLMLATVEERAVILCALDTLMRLSNVAGLKREQDHGSYITVLNPKVRGYKIPVSSRLRKALDAVPHQGDYYFETYQGGSAGAIRNRVARAFIELLERAHVPVGRKTGGMSFHCLRHTGASRMLARGVDIKTVQLLGGWSNTRVLERYLHPTDAARTAAVERVGVA